jgi:hypothetical protein
VQDSSPLKVVQSGSTPTPTPASYPVGAGGSSGCEAAEVWNRPLTPPSEEANNFSRRSA